MADRTHRPTPNAVEALRLDRVLAAHVAGEWPMSDKDLEATLSARAKLQAHFQEKRLCPTCGGPLMDHTLLVPPVHTDGPTDG